MSLLTDPDFTEQIYKLESASRNNNENTNNNIQNNISNDNNKKIGNNNNREVVNSEVTTIWSLLDYCNDQSWLD